MTINFGIFEYSYFSGCKTDLNNDKAEAYPVKLL